MNGMANRTDQSWSIVIVGYNEEGTVLRVLDAAEEAMRVIAPPQHEIVIVDDGSTDGSTRLLAEHATGRPHVRVVLHGSNKGIGEALRTSYQEAAFENVMVVPGDGQFDLRELYPFAHVPPRTLVSFTRETDGSYSPYRRALSQVNRALNRAFLGMAIRDVNWVKIFKRDDLRRLDLTLRSSLVQSEVCAKLVALGYAVIEPSSKYLPRERGKGRGGSARIVAQAARDTWSLTRVVRQFKRTHPTA